MRFFKIFLTLKSDFQKINQQLKIFFVAFLFSFIIFSGLTNLIFNLIKIQQQKKILKQELIFWKDIVSRHPEYPDGWAKLATIWYNLRRYELARLAIEKARKLDPIRSELRLLEERVKNF